MIESRAQRHYTTATVPRRKSPRSPVRTGKRITIAESNSTTMSITVQDALTPLVGIPMRSIGRAANLLWLHFGRMRDVPAQDGAMKSVGEWAVHIQCPWRICRSGQIVVAYHDYYYKPDGNPLNDDWDSHGKSRFDFVARGLITEFETTPPTVASVTPDDVGGFSLRFSGEYRLDVFPDDSQGSSEHWRIFQPVQGSRHLVFPETDARSGL
jgi:hypothetical protein